MAALVGVLAVTGGYQVRQAYAREQADGWARAIVHDLTAAQQAAITRRTTVTATFQYKNYGIGIVGGGVLRQDTLPESISFGSIPQTLNFDRRGVPAGVLAITMTTTAGLTYVISVDAGTGRVTHVAY